MVTQWQPPEACPLAAPQKKDTAPAPKERRKAQRGKRSKPLRSQAILDAAHSARPVVKPPAAKKRKPQAAAEKQLVPAPQAGSRHARASSGRGGVYDLWGVEEVDPVRREAEGDFDELAQALAAKARTPYGILRPAKRRCSLPIA